MFPFWESWKERNRFVTELVCVTVAQLVEHQYGKLQIFGLNPGFDTNFFLSIYHLSEEELFIFFHFHVSATSTMVLKGWTVVK